MPRRSCSEACGTFFGSLVASLASPGGTLLIVLLSFLIAIFVKTFSIFDGHKCPLQLPSHVTSIEELADEDPAFVKKFTRLCLRPLFQKDYTKMDIHIFFTKDPKIQYWTQEGLEELKQAHVFSQYNVVYGKELAPRADRYGLSSEEIAALGDSEISSDADAKSNDSEKSSDATDGSDESPDGESDADTILKKKGTNNVEIDFPVGDRNSAEEGMNNGMKELLGGDKPTIWARVPILERFPELISASIDEEASIVTKRMGIDGMSLSNPNPKPKSRKPKKKPLHLYAHVFLVRSGTGSLDEHFANIGKENIPSTGPERGLLTKDVLHGHGRVTEYLLEGKRKRRRHLLSGGGKKKQADETNSTDTNSTSVDTASSKSATTEDSADAYKRDDSTLADAQKEVEQRKNTDSVKPVVLNLPSLGLLNGVFTRLGFASVELIENDAPFIDTNIDGSWKPKSADDAPFIDTNIDGTKQSLRVGVYTLDVLQWALAFFVTTAFCSPVKNLGIARGIVSMGVVPFFANLHMAQNNDILTEERNNQRAEMEKRRAMKRAALKRAKEKGIELSDEEASQLSDDMLEDDENFANLESNPGLLENLDSLLIGKTRQLTAHLVPKLTIAIALDDQAYDSRREPPLQYVEMKMDMMQAMQEMQKMKARGRQPQPIEKYIRYPVHDGGKDGIRYGPGLSVENFGVLQRNYVPLSTCGEKDKKTWYETDEDGTQILVEGDIDEFSAANAESSVTTTTTLDPEEENADPNNVNKKWNKKNPQVQIDLEITGMLRFSIHQMLKQSLNQYKTVLGISTRDLEEVQEWLFRHPLHILAIMQVIGFLQMLLTSMAFKNDVAFFKGRSDYRGLSSRSLASDTLQQVIIFLYLMDFDDLSWMIVFQNGVGVAINLWKYWNVAKLDMTWLYLAPWVASRRKELLEKKLERQNLRMQKVQEMKALADARKAKEEGKEVPEKIVETSGTALAVVTPLDAANMQIITRQEALYYEAEKVTEEIDALGMFYLRVIMYPLAAGWGFYNLYHYAYKSWWSWFISTLANFAYTFGFINMCPQIFINYKLKSVAHMPWKVLVYKFFTTFVDDVFAFFVMADYMSAKHRWMTLRDDVLFFVFIYQYFIYVEDFDRPDEYGYVYKQEKAEAEKKKNGGSSGGNTTGSASETEGARGADVADAGESGENRPVGEREGNKTTRVEYVIEESEEESGEMVEEEEIDADAIGEATNPTLIKRR